jgi:hypothetical protein
MLTVILAALISGVLLFIVPIHGLADNGDFYRAMLSNGIYRLPSKETQFIDFVIPKFGILQYFNENNVAVFSSQSLFIQVALFLNKLLYSKTIFDIRFLALIYYVFYLGGLYLLTKVLVFPYRKKGSYVVALLVVLILTDSSFTLYFNSFFAEPGMLIGLLYAFSAVLAIARKVYRRNWPMLLVFFVSTCVLILSKQQNAPSALSFAVMAVGFLFIPTFKTRRVVIVGGILGVLGVGIFMYSTINAEFSEVNTYQAFTHGVLTQTDDPSKKITQGEISEQYALMRNQNYYSKTYDAVKASDKEVAKHLTNHLGIGWIVKYYALHGKQFMNLLDLSATDLMITQVKAVGDYTKESGQKPGKQVTYFTLFSAFMGAFFPGRFAFVCLLAISFVAVYGVGLFIGLRAHQFEGVMRFFAVAALMSIVVFVPIITIIGDGDADLAKHLFLCPLSIDLAIVLFVSDVIHHRLWREKEVEL